VEPHGLARLEAGDTPEAAAVAGHLAGCPSCAEELSRLRRAAAILRPALAGTPTPELRERTLAFVRAVGRPRGDGAGEGTPTALLVRPPEARRGRRRIAARAWLAAAAVLLVVAFGSGLLLAGRPSGGSGPDAALAAVTRAQAQVLAAPDAISVALAEPAGTARGTLAAAPSTGQIVVAATGLAPAPAGREYTCWVESGGQRTRLGTMWFAGDVAWWAGPAALPASLPAGTSFGVSLGEVGGSAGETVLIGTP